MFSKKLLFLGSCWTFLAAGAIEGIKAIATGELINLYEQELLDCDDLISHGCDSGCVNKAFDWVLSNGGIASAVDYPHYKAKKGTCQAHKVLFLLSVSFHISLK